MSAPCSISLERAKEILAADDAMLARWAVDDLRAAANTIVSLYQANALLEAALEDK